MTAPTIDPPAVDTETPEPAAPAAPTGPLGSLLIATFERCWSTIQVAHPDVPDVVMILGSGRSPNKQTMKWGHFHNGVWHGRTPTEADQDALSAVPEVFVGGEGLAREAREVFGTLLHESAHGIAAERGIKDTSREGRYHNKKFKTLAEEVGIVVEHDKRIGYSVTSVPDETAAAYHADIEALAAVIIRYRDEHGSGRKAKKKAPPLVCACDRKIRVAKKTLDLGPILCGTCGESFAPQEDDEDES